MPDIEVPNPQDVAEAQASRFTNVVAFTVNGYFLLDQGKILNSAPVKEVSRQGQGVVYAGPTAA